MAYQDWCYIGAIINNRIITKVDYKNKLVWYKYGWEKEDDKAQYVPIKIETLRKYLK